MARRQGLSIGWRKSMTAQATRLKPGPRLGLRAMLGLVRKVSALGDTVLNIGWYASPVNMLRYTS